MDLSDLYQSVILDHTKRPRNFHAMAGATGTAEGRNPLCGDVVQVWLRANGDTIEEVSFLGAGCAISKASASMMTAAVKGKSRAEVGALFTRVHDLVTGKVSAEEAKPELGSLVALGGVARFPVRVKCASLAWHALRQALDRTEEAPGTGHQAPGAH